MALEAADQKEKVKKLIIEANNALEKHNFEKTFQKCEQALNMDYDNPNIHLLVLLAEYKVTEIEDLKNCNVDFNSEKYKNVRRFANKELNDELDKYLTDKYNYKLFDNLKINNYSQFLSEKFWNKFFIKSKHFFIQQIKALYGKYPSNYSANDNDYEIVTIKPAGWEKETSFNINLNITINSIGSAAFYIKAILMGPIIILSPFFVLASIGNLNLPMFISASLLCIGLFSSLRFNYKKPIYFVIKKYAPIFLFLNSIFSLFLTIASLILIYYLYFYSFNLLAFFPQYTLATLIGIIPHFLILIHYRHSCRFMIYAKRLWLTLKKSSR